MDLALLKYFCVVAETQHMTKAAGMLNISQPSLSSAIKRLEREIGFELFDRQKNSIVLNEYGKIFLESVTAAEKEWLAGIDRMAELRKLKENYFTLCIPSSPAKQHLMEALLFEGFSLKFSNLPDNWPQALFANTIDLVATLEEFESAKLKRVILRYDEIVIVSSNHHPLAHKERVTVEDVNSYPFSSTFTKHSPMTCAGKQLAQNGLKPRVTFFASGQASVIHSIKSSDRLGLMVKHHLPPGHNLTILPVENLHIVLPIYLYWNTDNSKASINRVIEYIEEYYNNLSD